MIETKGHNISYEKRGVFYYVHFKIIKCGIVPLFQTRFNSISKDISILSDVTTFLGFVEFIT